MGVQSVCLLAIGDKGEGVPVCYFITSNEQAATLVKALQQFKSFLDAEGGTPTRPSTTMTDDSDSE